VDLVNQHKLHPGAAAVAHTALTMSGRFAREANARPKNRANSTANIRAVAAGGTVT
jgi:hypothetical protein